MINNKEKLIESIFLYLRKNDLDGHTTLYTIEEWKERGEDYLNDSEFVIISEGGLYSILNYGDCEDFYDLIESFGYFIEMGHSWSYGFYFDNKISGNDTSDEKTYSEKLKDERWQKKRDKVKERANYMCQDCGSKEALEVHHCYYKFGLEPWQYPFDSLRCLCRDCHKKRGKIEMELRARMADLTSDELMIVSEFIYGGMKYYPIRKISELIERLNINEEDLEKELKNENILPKKHI